MDDRFRIRPARPDDLTAITGVELVAFADPWPRPALAAHLADHFRVADGAGGRILGYVIGRVVEDEAEILNLAIHPAHRRRGVARRLVEDVLAGFGSAGVRRVFLEVRAGNRGAIRLYRGLGFEMVGIRPRYYARPPEDALVFCRIPNG